jgi:UDP-N-acetylmuramoylalanine--D-glutamate ligase
MRDTGLGEPEIALTMNSTFSFRSALVIGLDEPGRSAARCLRRGGVRVVALEAGTEPMGVAETERLRAMGVEVRAMDGEIEAGLELAVVSPSVSWSSPMVRALVSRGIEVISELELGYRRALCLNLAVAGTNGKGSTCSMLSRMLEQGGRRVAMAGSRSVPVCEVVDRSRELDYLVVETETGQLEGVEHFRPAVAILLNLAPIRPGDWPSAADLTRVTVRLFRRQQCFDWAIVQSEALAQIRALGHELPSKVITFSANNPRADLWMDRGLLLSRLPGWSGPLLDLDTCRVWGPHYAENLMAVLAAGHVLRVPLDDMVRALRGYVPAPGCSERMGEHGGVVFVNDGSSRNPEALRGALQGIPEGAGGEANVWLIAGGADDGHDFHDLGPLLARRVKHAFLFGPASARLRAAWSLFTPCTGVGSLLEALQNAVDAAVRGDRVLFSPACSCGAMFSSSHLRGEAFRQAVVRLVPGLVEEGVAVGGAGAVIAGSGSTGNEADCLNRSDRL